MNIFIGNLSFKTTDDDLLTAFEKVGTVTSARVAKDRDTGRSRGYGFVEMPDDAKAKKAIETLNGQPMQGRPMRVAESTPREPRGNTSRIQPTG